MARKSSKTEPVEVKPNKAAPKKAAAIKPLPADKKSPAKKTPAVKKAVSSAQKSPTRAKKTAKTIKGGSHNPNKTTAKQLEIAMRRERVLEILKSGASYSKIAKLLKSEGIKDASKSTVFADVEFLLSDNLKNLELSTEQYVALELERLDELYFAFYTKVIKEKDVEAARVLLSITVQRDKLRGLSKPKKVEIDARGALAKLLGVDENELPDE